MKFYNIQDEELCNKLTNLIIYLRNRGISIERIRSFISERYHVTRFEVKTLVNRLENRKSSWGGYRPGSGKGSKYLYDNEIYDSKAELCYKLMYPEAIKNYEYINIQLQDNEDYKYTPDFKLNDNYVEIKSSETFDYWGWNHYKIRNFVNSGKLIVVDNREASSIVQFIESKFGAEHIESFRWTSSFNIDLNWSKINLEKFSQIIYQ
jgi:hypothetical protein